MMLDDAPPPSDDDAPPGPRRSAGPRTEPDRRPPHDLAAEEAIIGAALVTAGRAYDDAADTGLDPTDFYAPRHQHVWHAISRLIETGRPTDPVTVAAELANHGLLDEVGGNATLIALQAGAFTTAAAGQYARIVIGHARLRRLLAAAAQITTIGYGPVDDVDQAAAAAEALITDAADRPTASRAEPLQRLMPPWLADTLGENHGPPGIQTPWSKLNTMTGGLRPGQLIVVHARPGTGKSAWAHNLCAHTAEHGHPTLLSTLEMSAGEVIERVISARSLIRLDYLRHRSIGANDRQIIADWGAHIATWPLYVHDNPEQTVARVHADARRIPGLALAVIDYAQLLQPPAPRHGARYDGRQSEVAAISRSLKILARSLRIPVVVLAQANRDMEGRSKTERRPKLKDIRESGQLENDADLVIGLYRDELHDPDTKDRDVLEQLVLKQRSGPLGTVRSGWDGGTQRITDLDHPTHTQQETF